MKIKYGNFIWTVFIWKCLGKSGLNPSEVVTLYKHIRENLDTLQVQGLMEIGSGDFDYSQGLPNPDFQCLLDIREKILAEEPQVDVATFHISMGMSNDFEEAVGLFFTSLPPTLSPLSSLSFSLYMSRREYLI